jgi:hypothetical protein
MKFLPQKQICFKIFYRVLLFSFLFSIFYLTVHRALARLHLTSWQLCAGGASTAVRTGAKLANLHKFSGEPLPRLRQTARCVLAFVNMSICYFLRLK